MCHEPERFWTLGFEIPMSGLVAVAPIAPGAWFHSQCAGNLPRQHTCLGHVLAWCQQRSSNKMRNTSFDRCRFVYMCRGAAARHYMTCWITESMLDFGVCGVVRGNALSGPFTVGSQHFGASANIVERFVQAAIETEMLTCAQTRARTTSRLGLVHAPKCGASLATCSTISKAAAGVS